MSSPRITSTSSLATKGSAEEILVVPFASEICHRSMLSKFDSFACGFHGTIFEAFQKVLLNSDLLFSLTN